MRHHLRITMVVAADIFPQPKIERRSDMSLSGLFSCVDARAAITIMCGIYALPAWRTYIRRATAAKTKKF
jgi:hypothetical protein